MTKSSFCFHHWTINLYRKYKSELRERGKKKRKMKVKILQNPGSSNFDEYQRLRKELDTKKKKKKKKKKPTKKLLMKIPVPA